MSLSVIPSIGINPGTTPRTVRVQTQASSEPSVPVASTPEPAQPIVQSPDKALATFTPPNTHLSIEHDAATNRYVFKSVDENTGEVIRQYPTEQMLTQIAHVRRITGLTVDKGT